MEFTFEEQKQLIFIPKLREGAILVQMLKFLWPTKLSSDSF